MYYNTLFQNTIIKSLLYDRRKKIDEIACSDNIKPEDINDIISNINSISLDDSKLEKRLEQTQINISKILDSTIKGFTNDDINAVKKIDEYLEYSKKIFSDYKQERRERESSLKDEFNSGRKLAFSINKLLNNDDREFMDRYRAYISFCRDVEEPLAQITLRKWENQITKPGDYKKGDKFKFIIHAIGTDVETALCKAKSKPIISTSLITNEFQGTYRNSKFGFVYQPNLENVLLISSSDCYAEDLIFLEKESFDYFSLMSIPLGANTYLGYNDGKACKTMHIEEIEIDSKKTQKSSTEGVESQDDYNEIVLLNNPSTNPIAVFLLEKENTDESSMEKADTLAKILHLPLLRI